MSITANSGPLITFGAVLTSTAGTGLLGNDLEHNPQRAPMVSDLGDAMMDPRVAYAYQPGSNTTVQTLGFYNNAGTVDYVPLASSAAASAFVSATVVATGVSGAFTLNAASSATGTFSTTITAPETGKVSGTLIAIDSTAAVLAFGQTGSVCVWNPGAGTGRNIVIKPSSNLDAGSYTIAGRDMYGFKMTEQVAAGSTNLAGKKAFKYISSITNASAPTSTSVSIGIGDVYGFPLFTPYAGLNAQVSVNSTTLIGAVVPLSTTNFIAALGTSITATATTADVRGTFTSTTASNSVQRLQILVTPAASAIATISQASVVGLFGVTQFSSV